MDDAMESVVAGCTYDCSGIRTDTPVQSMRYLMYNSVNVGIHYSHSLISRYSKRAIRQSLSS